MRTPQAMSGEPLLRVEDLHTHFRVRKAHGLGKVTLRAVDGASFVLRKGETLGLVGESGCGKTTLGRTILGLHRPAAGRIRLKGDDLATLSARARRARSRAVQVVFQDPYSSLDPKMTVGAIVAEPLRINGGYRAERIAELMRAVGLAPDATALMPAQFSGGQRQRIALARALALDPDLIILDEAVSALDVSIQAQILNLLRRLQREIGVSYLFISHNLGVVRHVADRVAVMYLGRIIEIGTRDALFGNALHPYTQALLSAIPRPVARRKAQRIILRGDLPNPLDPPSGCAFRTRCFKAQPDCATRVPQLRALDPGTDHLVACHYAAPLDAASLEIESPPERT